MRLGTPTIPWKKMQSKVYLQIIKYVNLCYLLILLKIQYLDLLPLTIENGLTYNMVKTQNNL